MRDKLEELGLREEYDEPRELHSGLKSKVFWDIEKLFSYAGWVQDEALREFTFQVGALSPVGLIGVPTGGLLLARLVAFNLRIRWYDCKKTYASIPEGCFVIDDVLTTGKTVRSVLHAHPTFWVKRVAVLVNRSGLDEIEGIPVLSGIKADRVTSTVEDD